MILRADSVNISAQAWIRPAPSCDSTNAPDLVRRNRGRARAGSFATPTITRTTRNRVNKQVMTDPRITSVDPTTMPFDAKRTFFVGFKSIVEL
jgi:uncharacterized protein YbaA (DUF1428 family)